MPPEEAKPAKSEQKPQKSEQKQAKSEQKQGKTDGHPPKGEGKGGEGKGAEGKGAKGKPAPDAQVAEKPKAPPEPPRAPADPRLKFLKKFHGKFLPKGPLRERLKAIMTRWNSGEDHGGVTVDELKALYNDWKAARSKKHRAAQT